ncbi:MAG: hypothetical protein K5656_06960 [Lachnospiraceae bacterium]|nr:hypothetical protein [Lachnospiraceae bacterium]
MTFTLGLQNLPFEPVEKQVIYVENEYNIFVNNYILKNYDVLRSRFNKAGYQLCYFPKLTDELFREDVVIYNAPFSNSYDANLKFKSDYLLQFMESPEERVNFPPSLIVLDPYKIHNSLSTSTFHFRAVALTKSNCYEDIDHFIDSVLLYELDGVRFCRREKRFWDNWNFRFRGFGRKKEEQEDEYDDWKPDSLSNPIFEEEQYDEEAFEMLNNLGLIAEKLRKKGVEEWMINSAVNGEAKLSRLHITKDCRIFLPDYRNIEIKMTPIHKALYFLYLDHPEGLAFHDLVDYKFYLMDAYKKIKGGLFNAVTAETSIDNIINHTNNSIYEKISRIKLSFHICINDRYARYYYIDGDKNNPKKILLPRDLVEWER